MQFEELDPYKKAGDLETRVTLLSDGYELDYPDPSEVNNLLGLTGKELILDAGCGIGTTLLPFGPQLKDTPNMVGFDFSLAVLERAQELQSQRNLPPLQLVHGDIQNLPFPNQQFDLVLARHMLYHVPEIPKAAREIARVLKPKGLFMATANSMHSRPELNDIHRKALAFFPDAKFIERGSARFGSENGEDVLRASFSSVQTIPWYGHMRYKTTDDAIRYYTSTVYYQYALEDGDQKDQLRTMVAHEIESIIERQGYFDVTSWGAIFLARNS